jgi:hypothetical protein
MTIENGIIPHDSKISGLPGVYYNQALEDEWNRKIHILEAIYGRYFFTLPKDRDVFYIKQPGLVFKPPSKNNVARIYVTYIPGQLELLDEAYNALVISVNSQLFLQKFLSCYD